MEQSDKFISELLWRKDQSYKELALDYYRLQLEYQILEAQFEILFERLKEWEDLNNGEND